MIFQRCVTRTTALKTKDQQKPYVAVDGAWFQKHQRGHEENEGPGGNAA